MTANGTATRARVLLVDDSKVMRKAALKMLSDECDVVVAEDGVDGWRQLEADTTIQVVFSDLSMPRLDGYGLLKKIRTADDPGIAGMPVIIVTGAENDDAAREKALDMGATDFITKPFNSTDLVARARAHAKYQRVKQQLQEQVTVDLLTGLANKNGFMERLKQDISFTKRHQQPLSLVRLEIDDFKKHFLAHGKDVADAMVMHVARVIRSRIRKEDTAARIGLAHFAISLPTGKADGSKGLADRIRAEIAAHPLNLGGKPLHIMASGGVLTPEAHPGLTAMSAMEECQQVLDAAIKAGGNRVLGDTDIRKMRADVLLPSKPVPPTSPEVPIGQVRIDELLAQIERGETQAATEQLPQALKRMLPILKLLNERQRNQLIQFLQKAGQPGG
ncbi:MAG: GGDEF domain-containing response regulator [Pseudomonadota bacterium]